MQKNNETLYAQIDPYLSGQLSEAESAAMQQALLHDAELAQEVELRRLEFEVAEGLVAQRIRDQLRRLRTEPPLGGPPQPIQKERFSIPKWAIAAMLVIVAIGVYWWAMPLTSSAPPLTPSVTPVPPPDSAARPPQADNTPVPQPSTPPAGAKTEAARHLALATQLYRDPDFQTLRGAAPGAGDPFEAAFLSWEKQDWAAVLTALRNVAANDPQHIRAQAFRAHAQFKLKRFGSAAQTFAAVSDSRTQPWAEEADWYVLLALLADGQAETPGFQTRLGKVLSDAGHPYFAEAEYLKRQLGM